jgi:hypothetical protein
VLKDVAPAAGTTVPNQNIVEKFTIVDPPFVITGLSFQILPKHTGGTTSPLALQFTVASDGKDDIYRMTVDSWSTAPGHVEIGVPGVFLNGNDCAFVFPSPLFSYDVTNP